VLVDHTTGDDAGVYRLDEKTALVQTVDFFTPVVDDPEAFGMIAAANALSDVYAMGGRPLTALSIAAFPEDDFPPEWAAAIVRGGATKLQEAGCALLGGHSVRDPEIKFGYAVTGLIDPERILTNAGGQPGDALVLTKPLGTGVIATALKAGQAPAEAVEAATRSMSALNARAAEVALRHEVQSATDVTGFGLAGHLGEMLRASKGSAVLDLAAIPALPGAVALLGRGTRSTAHPENARARRAMLVEPDAARRASLDLLFDPQTSGGLLLALPRERSQAMLSALRDAGDGSAAIIGEIAPPRPDGALIRVVATR
jgi:selenide, water dikinase